MILNSKVDKILAFKFISKTVKKLKMNRYIAFHETKYNYKPVISRNRTFAAFRSLSEAHPCSITVLCFGDNIDDIIFCSSMNIIQKGF